MKSWMIITLMALSWGITIGFQIDSANTNEQLRRQLGLVQIERDLARTDLNTCRGDFR